METPAKQQVAGDDSGEIRRVRVIDSHTGGEPTRIVVSGGPDLTSVSLFDRRDELRARHDTFRSAVVNEPRGSDAVVGGFLCEPEDPSCDAGVIYFNNVDYLNMCVHGTIGLAVTLKHLGRVNQGVLRIETPVGVVTATLRGGGEVSVSNVPSWRAATGIAVEVPGYGTVTGDIAWGGNWFFLVSDHGQDVTLANTERLTHCAWAIRQALNRSGITGEDGGEIDHIELFAPPENPENDSKNFVLCPGKAYDRSPCGTGTSAKLACLHATGKLPPGRVWRQESIVGSVFSGTVESIGEGKIIPTITGSAFVNAEADLLLNPGDPFQHGIRNR